MKKKIGFILGMAIPVIIAAVSELSDQIEANKMEEELGDIKKRLSSLEQQLADSE